MTREEFKELGWIILKDIDYQFDGQLLKNEYEFFDFTYDIEDFTLCIEEFYQSKMCARTAYVDNPNLYNSKTVFQGIIKTKEEMSTLMKQLNII